MTDTVVNKKCFLILNINTVDNVKGLNLPGKCFTVVKLSNIEIKNCAVTSHIKQCYGSICSCDLTKLH